MRLAFQSKGGQAYGADAFVTVQLGDYVKDHKIETLFAGGGSKVHTQQREACIRSNVLARKFSGSASRDPAIVDGPGGFPVRP